MQKVRKGQEACKGLPAQQSPCKVRSQKFSSMAEDGSNRKSWGKGQGGANVTTVTMAEDQKGLIDQEGRFRSIGGRQNGNRQRSDGGVKGRDAGNYLQINSSRIYCTADDTELTSCPQKGKKVRVCFCNWSDWKYIHILSVRMQMA